MSQTQINSSVQRRLSTVHLAGLSILAPDQLVVRGSEQQQHNRNVLIDALVSPAVLLSIGRVIARNALDMLTDVIHVIIMIPTRSLKSSDNVTLCLVRDVNEYSFVE